MEIFHKEPTECSPCKSHTIHEHVHKCKVHTKANKHAQAHMHINTHLVIQLMWKLLWCVLLGHSHQWSSGCTCHQSSSKNESGSWAPYQTHMNPSCRHLPHQSSILQIVAMTRVTSLFYRLTYDYETEKEEKNIQTEKSVDRDGKKRKRHNENYNLHLSWGFLSMFVMFSLLSKHVCPKVLIFTPAHS